jgi:hypothetical protein
MLPCFSVRTIRCGAGRARRLQEPRNTISRRRKNTLTISDDAGRDQIGPLPASIQARLHLLAKRESHARFLDRMGADDGGYINSRPGPIPAEPELDDNDNRPAGPSPETS